MKNINVQQQSHNSIISSINPLENQQVHSYRCQKGLKILWSDFFVAKYCALCNLKVDLNPNYFYIVLNLKDKRSFFVTKLYMYL